MHAVGDALQGHVDGMLGEVKQALGVPKDGNGQRSGFASYGASRESVPALADTDTHPSSVSSVGADGSSWSPQGASVGRAD